MFSNIKSYLLSVAIIILYITNTLANKDDKISPEQDYHTGYLLNPIEVIDRQFSSLDDYWSNLFNDRSFFYRGNSIKSKIITEDKQYVVVMEVPGYDKSQIKVNLQNNRLVINGNNKIDDNQKDVLKNYSNKKSQFNYTITLNGDIEQKAISSNLKNGILTIILPRREIKNEKSKEIPIQEI